MSCARCCWSDPAVATEGVPVLLCRVNPPQVFVVNGETCSGWPQVSEEDWCSHYGINPEGDT